MSKLGRTIVASLIMTGIAYPAGATPLLADGEALWNFIWHAGDGEVKKLPHAVSFQLVSNPDYDPDRDVPTSPPGEPLRPEPCLTNATCPGFDEYGTALGKTDTCLDNRPEILVLDRAPDSPALDLIFAIPGPDNELGVMQDYADVAQPVEDAAAMEAIMDDFRARYADGDPTNDPEEHCDFKPLFRGLALERDDPAINASLAPLCRQPNPFRGRQTPTRLFEAEPQISSPSTPPRDAGSRYHDLDIERGLFDPMTGCDGGPCPYGPDPVDDGLRQLEALTIGARDTGVSLGQINPGSLSPNNMGEYPNYFFGRSYFFDEGGFGGDFSGIDQCEDPVIRKLSGAIWQDTNFGRQLSGSLLQPECIPYTNVAVAGGGGELPMRPAPDRSNLETCDPAVAQGLDFPFPEGAESYERNVDPNTGRPRKAGATGRCENAAAFPIDLNPLGGSDPGQPESQINEKILHAGNSRLEFVERAKDPAAIDYDVVGATRPTGERTAPNAYDDYARRPEAYTYLGVGIDEDCLKPGGAPDFPHENRFDLSLVPNLEDFAPEDYSVGDKPAIPQLGDRPDPGTYVYNTLGQWGLEGSSVDYALAHHPGNQGLFAWICSASMGAFASLAPGACLVDVFGSTTGIVKLGGALTTPSFAEIITTILAGEIDDDVMDIMSVIVTTTKDDRVLTQVGIAPLNRDLRDGRTNTGPWADKSVPNAFRDFLDSTTMGNSLTNEQKALLGCGPFYGTRCDMGRPEDMTNVPTFGSGSFSSAGGIDVLNAEADAMLVAVPGGEALASFEPFFLDELVGLIHLYADAAAAQAAGDTELAEELANGEVTSWVTWSSHAQPGTIGFEEDSPHCMRFDPESPFANEEGLVRLPGCRGAVGVALNETDPAVGTAGWVDVEFEDFYTARQDGCPFGKFIDPDGAGPLLPYQVRAVNADGTPNDKLNDELNQTCFNTTGTLTTDIGVNISLVSDHRWSNNPYFGKTQPRLGARTLFHPFASCEDSGTRPDGVTPIFNNPGDIGFLCDFRFRNYEKDFLAGNAQVFRSEIAALSWNLLMFLVITSCNTRTGDDLADEDCFDPLLSWAMGRCSFSQPHLCRNTQLFLELALDENRNGIPDNAEGVPVEIDISPSDPENQIRLTSLLPITVAILGSEAVDVSDVDVTTLAFGPDGAAPMHDLSRFLIRLWHLRDVNRDGFTDLITHYGVQETGIALGDTEVCLSGEIDGEPFESCDQIVVTSFGCGIGVELLLILPPLMWLRQRRRHAAIPRRQGASWVS